MCNKTTEFVEIRDGGSEVSPVIDKYCVPPRITNSIRSSGNFMFVRFVTNSIRNLVNFKATVRINDCGGTYYVSRSQQYSLPSYPNNYTNNMECIYFFRSYYSSYRIEVNITNMDIAANSDCSSGEAIAVYIMTLT